MNAAFEIVRATTADAGRIAPLFAAYREFYKQTGDAPACEIFLNERLFRGESVVFIAEDATRSALGFAQLYPTFTSVGLARVWHLNDLYVREASRRLGVGRALVQHCLGFARRDGAARLTLETQGTNAPARALYDKLGFTLGSEFVKYAVKFE